MKRLFVLIMSLIMALSMAVPVFAADKTYVLDNGDKITLASESELNAIAKEFADKYGVDMVYMDAAGSSDSALDMAKALKDDYAEDSVILVHNLDTNKVGTVAYGQAGKVLKDSDLDELYDIYNKADTYKKGVQDYFALAEKKLIASGKFKDNSGAEDFSDLDPAVTEPIDQTEPTEPRTIPDHRLKERLVDDAGLLTADQEETLLDELNTISTQKQMDVVVYFAKSFSEATVVDAADDYYDYNGFGYGTEREGILMYVCMDTRDIYFSTCGPNTISKFTDSNLSTMVSDVGPYLTQEQYVSAVEKYMDDVDYYTVDHYNFIALIGSIIAFLGGGLAIGSGSVAKHRNALKSVRFKSEANNYVRQGSLNLIRNTSTFIRTDVTRVYDPPPKDSGGGGSSTHTSSSGTSHGGGGGKF